MTKHLTPEQLAERMEVCTRTVERWRESGSGPRFISKGKVVRYRLADIEKWEVDNMAQTTLQALVKQSR